MSSDALFPTVLVPMDFSPPAQGALEAAASFCEQGVAGHLVLVHGNYIPVELAEFGDEIGALTTRISERASDMLSGQLTGLLDRGISAEYQALRGPPSEVIVEAARSNRADLIVMGTHGHSGLAHLALGSVAERVVRMAPCPVLTVKRAAGDA